MDEELKSLVKQVESCFPERTKNTQVIDVATILLVKAVMGLAENMTEEQASHEVAGVVVHVTNNVLANVRLALMQKRLRNLAPKDPLSAQDLGIFTQILENESHLN